MKRYIEFYNESVARCGEDIAFSDGKMNITYNQLDESAGKIYRYLKEQGIGTEDFVQIVLERCPKIPVAVIGVIKAGAAFMLLEDTYPQERVDYIYQDCGCKLRIDNDLYEKIMSEYEPLEGNEETDPHDAMYAVYTSGSTGNPKGVLHEYGNADQSVDCSVKGGRLDMKVVATIAPYYFVSGVMDIIGYTAFGYTDYIIPHAMVRDFMSLKKYVEENKVEAMYFPPSYLRMYTNPSKYFKIIYTGSEPANGLSIEGDVSLLNIYSMSEAGFVVLMADLDRAYDVAPVGKPVIDAPVYLVGEDGNIIEGEGQGELCYVNEYVRGYINLPDMTARAWRDGLFHTNDCARRDGDGNYYIVGRYDDMIKINGNRIEPVEIESHIKELTGLNPVIAKGFNENGRSFICLYYINSQAEEKGLIQDGELVFDKDALKDRLPDYMIPTYYIGMNEFPLLPTGKVARKNLKAPDTSDYKREYVAPETEMEKYLCDAMAAVLKIEQVGVLDDFYEIGGDSMKTMAFIARCTEDGVGVKAQELYDRRIPRELAKCCSKGVSEAEFARLDEEARNKPWPLLISQQVNIVFGWKAGDSSALNIPTLYEMKPDVDADRLAAATNRVIAAHPGLQIKINTGGAKMTQEYEPAFAPDTKIIELSDEEFHANLESYNVAFKVGQEPMYSSNIYKTDKATYLFIIMHHSICDGMSRKLLMEQIAEAYKDDNYEVPRDYYFYLLSQIFAEEVIEEKKNIEAKYRIIKPDNDTAGGVTGVVGSKDLIDKSEKLDGVFFATAFARAATKYNGTDRIMLRSMFSGRNEWFSQGVVGDIASGISIDVKTEGSFQDVARDVKMQELYQANHPANRVVGVKVSGLRKLKNLSDMKLDESKNNKSMDAEAIRFNYQKNTLGGSKFDELAIREINKKDEHPAMNGSMSVGIIETENSDKISIAFLYDSARYNRESMQKLLELFLEEIQENR